MHKAIFRVQNFGATVATIFESEWAVVEVVKQGKDKFSLVIHNCYNGEWDDLSALLEPKHFEMLGSIPTAEELK